MLLNSRFLVGNSLNLSFLLSAVLPLCLICLIPPAKAHNHVTWLVLVLTEVKESLFCRGFLISVFSHTSWSQDCLCMIKLLTVTDWNCFLQELFPSFLWKMTCATNSREGPTLWGLLRSRLCLTALKVLRPLQILGCQIALSAAHPGVLTP